jgi:hypothetical protein
MLEIKNTEIHNLNRSLISAANPMKIGEINTINPSSDGIPQPKELTRGIALGSHPPGSAHDHYLVGIIVTFDIKYPSYWTIEAERYHWFTILSSQSKMHCLTKAGKSDQFHEMFNNYVDTSVIENVKNHINNYNNSITPEEKYINFMKSISNLPHGYEMWMTCQCSYLQLKTMYLQRKSHKLQEDWGAFCRWCETLPYFKELTGVYNATEKIL